ncbi:MAG: phosphoribosyltransferase family protein [Campylobacterota bacterium]|nr:phosphoribosyltransferase family protein [Campylobacterota bacterium]
MQNDLNHSVIFKDRDGAAKELIDMLPLNMFDLKNTVVIGVSEGGVYFAQKISKALKADMDILLTEQIKAPNNHDLSIAIVSETEEMVMNQALVDAFEIDEDYVYSEANRKYEDTVLSYVYKYRKGVALRSLEGKHVILIDESIETGLTMSVALKSMIEMNARSIYVAAPVLDYAVYDNLQGICDGVFCPHRIRDYISIEYYYEELDKLDFESLERIIDENGITDYKEKEDIDE